MFNIKRKTDDLGYGEVKWYQMRADLFDILCRAHSILSLTLVVLTMGDSKVSK